MGRRSGAARTRRIAIGGLAAGLAGAVGAVGLKLRSRRRAGAGALTAPVTEWSCRCGQEFRVSGVDRHRVYWLPDASDEDPVLDGLCPRCERPFPSEHPSATTTAAAS